MVNWRGGAPKCIGLESMVRACVDVAQGSRLHSVSMRVPFSLTRTMMVPLCSTCMRDGGPSTIVFTLCPHPPSIEMQVPFRLTRMMVKAMEVAGIEGNFRNPFVQCVGSLLPAKGSYAFFHYGRGGMGQD
eukprot:1151034-Pelagomonas_calceolata.AAC.5